MKIRLPLVLGALVLTSRFASAADAPAAAPAPAATAPTPTPSPLASAASVKELLEITHARRLVEGMIPQLQAFAGNVSRQATAGQKLTDAQKKAFDEAQAANLASYKQELSWTTLEPVFVEVYQKTFSQAEIDGIVAFYKTPAGQSLLDKLPTAMKNTYLVIQQRTGPITQRIQKDAQEAVKAAIAAHPAPAPAAAAAAPSPTPAAK